MIWRNEILIVPLQTEKNKRDHYFHFGHTEITENTEILSLRIHVSERLVIT